MHTPGPWRVEPYFHPQKKDLVPGSIIRVSSWCLYSEWEDEDENPDEIMGEIYGRGDLEANAHLIAAAPDLLEALEKILGWREIDRATLGERVIAIEQIATDAIKKARGE